MNDDKHVNSEMFTELCECSYAAHICINNASLMDQWCQHESLVVVSTDTVREVNRKRLQTLSVCLSVFLALLKMRLCLTDIL